MIIEDRSSKEEILAALVDFVSLSKTAQDDNDSSRVKRNCKTRDVLASAARRTQNPFVILSISSSLPVSGRLSEEEAARSDNKEQVY
jgi:hypothetical protein